MTYMAGFGASGTVVEDTVDFGSVSVKDVAVGVASNVGTGDYPDGMMGMGFKDNCMHLVSIQSPKKSCAFGADGNRLQSRTITTSRS